MSGLALWSGFLGAWLLVAGPVYQAAVELQAEGLDRDELAAALDGVVLPRRHSRWWWLLPPAGFVLDRRWRGAVRRVLVEFLTPEHLERSVRFSAIATGWVTIAAGASFIALKETWELAEHHGWPLVVYLGVVVVMAAACALNTKASTGRGRRILAENAALQH